MCDNFPQYQYTPLASDGTTFRVLYLYPGEGTRFDCEFLEIPISAKSNYTALSYTWGDPTVVSHVYVHGSTIGIASNLVNVFRRLRHPSEFRALWADALCINQQDNREKSSQIPLMTHIYGRTRLVTIYLGEEEDGSEHVLELGYKILVAGRKLYLQDATNANKQGDPIPPEKYEEYGLPSMYDHAWICLSVFLRRPWFTRVWVIQEAVLSSAAEVLCGTWKMEFSKLLLIITFAMAWNLPVSLVPDVRQETQNEESSALQLLLLMSELGAGRRQVKSEKLIDLLGKTRITFATDRHDYCYGLMGLSTDSEAPFIHPDYSLPVDEDYVRFAQYFVDQGDGVKVLYNAGHQLPGQPSWVPDWSNRDSTATRLSDLAEFKSKEQSGGYKAASMTEPMIRLDMTQSKALVVRGIYVDEIDVLIDSHETGFEARSGDFCQRVEVQSPHELLDRLSLEIDLKSLYGHRLKESFLQFHTTACYLSEIKYLLPGEIKKKNSIVDDDTVIQEIAVCGVGDFQGKAPLEKYSDLYRSFDKLLSTLLFPGAKFDRNILENMDAQELRQHRIFTSTTVSIGRGRRRCKTSRGYIGQVPWNSRIGDTIFLPLGSTVPFAFRRQESFEDVYEIIGQCYIYGIMNGEALLEASLKIEDIRLV